MPRYTLITLLAIFSLVLAAGCNGGASLTTAKAQYEAGDYLNAMLSLNEIIAKKNDIEALCYRARTNVKLGNITSAIADFEQCLRDVEYQPEGFDNMAYIAKRPFITGACFELFDLVCPIDKSQYGPKGYQSIDFHYPDEIFDKAKWSMVVHERLRPNDPNARLKFGIAHLVKGWPIPGYNNITVYTNYCAMEPWVLKWRADAARDFAFKYEDKRFAAKLIAGALHDYNEAIRLSPNEAVFYHSRGLYYVLADEKGKALRDFRTALEKNPKLSAASFDLALVLKDTGRFDQAYDHLTEAINNADDFCDALFNRAHLLVSIYSPWGISRTPLSQFSNNADANKQAISDLNKILEKLPTSYDTLCLLGDAYRNIRDFKSAADAFTMAIDSAPNSPNGYYRRGDSYGLMAEYEKCFADLLKAEELSDKLDPQYYLYWFTLGKYEQYAARTTRDDAQKKHHQEAIKYFQLTNDSYLRLIKHQAIQKGEINSFDEPVTLDRESAGVFKCIIELWVNSLRTLGQNEKAAELVIISSAANSGATMK